MKNRISRLMICTMLVPLFFGTAHAENYCGQAVGMNPGGVSFAQGVDRGFRWQYDEAHPRGGRCLDQTGIEGWNPNCLAPCGDFRSVIFQKPNFALLDLRGSNFSGAVLEGGYTEGADFSGAIFQDANLKKILTAKKALRASFIRADFRNALFEGAQLVAIYAPEADFRGADMHGVWWARAEVIRARFEGARMDAPLGMVAMDECGPIGSSSCFSGSRYDGQTTLPFTEKDAANARMIRVE